MMRLYYIAIGLSVFLFAPQGFANWSCQNSMMGWVLPSMYQGMQDNERRARERDQAAFDAKMAPFINGRMQVSRRGSRVMGDVVRVGQGKMSYQPPTHGETVYPVVVLVGTDASTHWMTMDEMRAAITSNEGRELLPDLNGGKRPIHW